MAVLVLVTLGLITVLVEVEVLLLLVLTEQVQQVAMVVQAQRPLFQELLVPMRVVEVAELMGAAQQGQGAQVVVEMLVLLGVITQALPEPSIQAVVVVGLV